MTPKRFQGHFPNSKVDLPPEGAGDGRLLLGCHDRPLDLIGQLVGVAHRPPRAVGERLQAIILVAVEDLVTGLARNPNSRHTSLMPSPSRRRATKRRRSSITEHSLHGINTSGRKPKVLPMCPVQNVTYVPGRANKINRLCKQPLPSTTCRSSTSVRASQALVACGAVGRRARLRAHSRREPRASRPRRLKPEGRGWRGRQNGSIPTLTEVLAIPAGISLRSALAC